MCSYFFHVHLGSDSAVRFSLVARLPLSSMSPSSSLHRFFVFRATVTLSDCWIQIIRWIYRNINVAIFTLTDNLIPFSSLRRPSFCEADSQTTLKITLISKNCVCTFECVIPFEIPSVQKHIFAYMKKGNTSIGSQFGYTLFCAAKMRKCVMFQRRNWFGNEQQFYADAMKCSLPFVCTLFFHYFLHKSLHPTISRINRCRIVDRLN